MEIQHFSHQQHPLLLREDKILNIFDQFRRGICNYLILAAPFYACQVCKYYAHEACTNLPNQIHDSLHPLHPLTLVTHRSFMCRHCEQYVEDGPAFRCVECYGCYVDIECGMMHSIHEGRQYSIQHVTHPHPLLLVEPKQYKEINIKCFACKSESSSSSDGVYYGCARCKYFLHDSCVDQLPKEIQHSLHSNHGRLTLVWRLNFRCRLCEIVDSCAFTFECRQCHFQLCAECGITNRRATIEYKEHDHQLCFIEAKGAKLPARCNVDDSCCKQADVFNSNEFNHTSCFMLCCLICEFKVHLLCGPLPSKITYEYHVHSLILVDSLIEDDFDEYYCNICETKRDPRFRVYYCEGCKYIAHVHCVIYEIIKVLTTNFREVELKTTREDIWKFPQEKGNNERLLEEGQGDSPLTLKDLIHELTIKEQKTLGLYYKWNDTSSKDKGAQVEESSHDIIAQSELEEEDINEILELSHFTREDIKKFEAKLDDFYLQTRLKLKSSDLALKIVNVEGYMIPYTLAPVLHTLLRKYGGISSWSNESQRKKCLIFFILCLEVKTMCSTRVIDITKRLLQEWYYNVSFAGNMGFRIDFADAHIIKLVRTFLVFQANRLEDEVPKKVEKKIDELHKVLGKCKEYRESTSKSEFLKDCLKEALELKWKDACEGLLK